MAPGTGGGRGSVLSSFTSAPPSSSGSSSPDFGQAGGISAWRRGSGGEETSLILAWFIVLPHEASDPAEVEVIMWKVRSCFGAKPNSARSPLPQ